MTAAAPGSRFRGLVAGVIPPVISGLGVGAASSVRVNTTTGLLERVSSPGSTDIVIGVSDVNGFVTARSAPGAPGSNAGAVPIAVMIDTPANINLSAGPTTFAGYALQIGDVVGMRSQSTTTNNRLYTYTASGVFTPLSTQPPDKSTLITLAGAVPYQLFLYQPTVISPLNAASAATIVGANGTVVPFAPDPAGGSNKSIPSEGIDVATLVAATPIILWQFDCVGRNFTTGVVWVTAVFVQKTNSGKAIRSSVETVLFGGSPPTFHNDSQQYDVDDANGLGAYGPLTWSISGNALRLSCTPALSGKGWGIVSFMAGNI